MNATIRRIAVSGAAAVALLGGAGTATAAASEEHEATVLAIAHSDTQDPADITGGLTPNGGQGAAIENPVTGTQPNSVNPQQIQTQASGGVIAGGVVAILILGIIVFVRVKHHDIKPGDAVVVTLFGIAVSGTVIGGLGEQLTGSAISALGGMLGGL
jgi:hypothetical protein